MKKMLAKIHFFAILYPFVFFLGIIFTFLLLTRRVKIKNWRRLLSQEGGMLVVSNHPSLYEPCLIPFLFFPKFIFHPHKFAPLNTPDKYRFYNKWWYGLLGLRLVSIPIARTGKEIHQEKLVLRKMVKFLRDKKIIIIFPEGTRTYKAIRIGNFTKSNRGKLLGQIKEEIGALAVISGTNIVPVWIDGSEKVLPNEQFPFPRILNQVVIKIGEPFSLSKDISPKEAAQTISQALLKLADQ